MKMLRFILTAFVLATTAFSSYGQASVTPVTAPSLIVTSVGSPTITVTPSTDQTPPTFQATFNAQLQAIGTDITIGLPTSTLPFVTWTDSGSVVILRNGTPDLNKNYKVSLSYTQPSAGVTPGAGSTFVLKQNNSVTIPITVAFIPISAYGSGNTYAVKLTLAYWSYSAGGTATALTDPGWTTASISGGGTTTTVTPVPDYIQALKSRADLAAYLAVTARVTDIYLSAASQVGGGVTRRIQHSGPVTTRILQDAIKNGVMQIKVSNVKQEVYYQIDVHSADYRIVLTDTKSQIPVPVKGEYVADFKMKLGFQGDALMLVSNIAQATLKKVDGSGKITDSISLSITPQGFYFPPAAVGSGILEITVNDGTPTGSVKSYDIRSASETTTSSVSVTVSASKADTEYVFDRGSGSIELNLIPNTTSGVGNNVLGEVEVTRDSAEVSVAAVTIEGRPGISVDYRQVTAVVIPGQAPVPVANPVPLSKKLTNGIVTLTLAKGDWQIIPRWNSQDLSEPPFYPPTYGKGSVDQATY